MFFLYCFLIVIYVYHMQNQISRASDTVYCKGISMLLLKAYWWVFLGMVVNNVVARLCEKKNHVTVQKRKQRKQSQSHKEGGTGRWGRKLLVLWVVSGLSVSIWLFWYMNADIILRRTETLANMCDERARMLQDQFNVSMNHVHALAILVSTFHHGKQPSAIDQVFFPNCFCLLVSAIMYAELLASFMFM